MASQDRMDDTRYRVTLARNVTSWALAVILAIALLTILVSGIDAIWHPSDEKAKSFFDTCKYVLGVLLPVIGAWVGTVLAFYFGKENFEAAARSATNLVRELSPREKLQAKPVIQGMLKINEVTTFKMPDWEDRSRYYD